MDISILTSTTRLLLVLALYRCCSLYSLSICYLWTSKQNVDSKVLLKLINYNSKLHITLSADKQLLCFSISIYHEGWILIHKLVQRGSYLFFISLVLWLNCHEQCRLWIAYCIIKRLISLITKGIASLCIVKL